MKCDNCDKFEYHQLKLLGLNRTQTAALESIESSATEQIMQQKTVLGKD